MKTELKTSIDFIKSSLYNKLPRRRVEAFGEELDRLLQRKFHGHWFPEQPLKDAACRCLRLTGEHTDEIVLQAAYNSGVDVREFLQCLPTGLTLWIDPGQVSYKIGEKGRVEQIYQPSDLQNALDDHENELRDSYCSLPSSPNPGSPVNFSLCHGLRRMSSMPAWSVSPESISPPPLGSPTWGSPSPAAGPTVPTFTAASFAQTKFGSTRARTPSKRPKKLSPTQVEQLRSTHPCESTSKTSRSPDTPSFSDYFKGSQRFALNQVFNNNNSISPPPDANAGVRQNYEYSHFGSLLTENDQSILSSFINNQMLMAN